MIDAKRLIKITLIAACAVIALVAVSVSAFFLTNAPEYYPEYVVGAGDAATEFFGKVTLPLKLAALSLQEPDASILMPVHGVRVAQVADTWGEPRPDNRVHEGQDIFAPRGTPIFSGTKGYVTRISNGDLGGNSVYVRGAGLRMYFYTHLDRFPDELSVGQRVGTDTVIGFVGNTGNAETTPPHLHFGVYELRKAINPLPLLKNR